MSRVVLVTGVSRDLGARVARSLAADGQHEVVGVDLTPPRRDLGGVRFVRADLRGPTLLGVLARHDIHTVVHCGLQIDEVITSPVAAKEANILGTMQLVAACQQSASVRHVVLRSSGQVYGASPLDPARFAEDTVPRHPPRSGPARHALEMESFVAGLAHRRADVAVTILRLANILGGHVDNSLSRWLSLPVVPRPMGFNARLQFLHPADAVRAVQVVVDRELPGTFNVAAEDPLTLTQVLRIMGRPGIGLTGSSPAVLAAGRRAKFIRFTSEQVRAVTWGRLLDTQRFQDVAGFVPHYSSRRAVEEFAAFTSPGMLDSDRIDRAIAQAKRVLSPAVEMPAVRWPRGVRQGHG
ncbi:NAD-dependent epimerase/dehydratase family protein [Granulicoccus sp. GXG6511]|uniref:NAD-dependent epimerase/dehydratase family protein n=1 Tax=Granulicoccus sp. GXG6511 TaxID=3381351 RepID=UPI003D7C8B19